MATDHALAPVLILEVPEHVRAYVHPTRMVILSLLAPEPRTVTHVARELAVHPANLTRHFRVLERAGLIELVEKRDTGRNLEKYYRAVARSFDVRLASDQIEDRQALVLRVLRDNLTTAIATTSGERSGGVVGLLGAARIDPARVPELQERMAGLIEELGTLDEDGGGPYCLSLALYAGEPPTGRPLATDRVVLGRGTTPMEPGDG